MLVSNRTSIKLILSTLKRFLIALSYKKITNIFISSFTFRLKMGKSSKKRKGRVAQLADSSSAESSRQATPATSDSEGSSTDVTPPSKKQKTEKNGPVKRVRSNVLNKKM